MQGSRHTDPSLEGPHHQAPRSLPSRDDDPLSLRNVPALESLASSRSDFGRSWRNVPAWERCWRTRSRLWRSGEKGRPAYLRERRRPPLPRGDDSLQRQDLAQTRAGFCVRKAGTLQSRVDVPRTPRNVLALESPRGRMPISLQSRDDARAQATQRHGSGGLLPPGTPASPKQGRCAVRRCVSARLRRMDSVGTKRPLESPCDRQPQFRRC